MTEQQNTPVTSEEQKPPEKPERKKSLGREILEWVLTFAFALALAFIIRTFIFEPVRVDGESMMNTLQNNEYMIATKFDYLFGEPERFDIVICKYPERNSTFVKRVIGLPGETVELRAGELYIDGVFHEQNFDATPSVRDYGPTVVPEGHYFVIGDNRDNSNDSRNAQVGALPKNMIRGHVRCVVYPFNRMRVINDTEQ